MPAQHDAFGPTGRRPVEGLSGGGAPVDEQRLEGLVGQPEAPDVVAGAVLQVDAPEAQGTAPDVVADERALQQADLGVALQQRLVVPGLEQPHLGEAGRRMGAQLGEPAVQPVYVALLSGVRIPAARRGRLDHPRSLAKVRLSLAR